MDCVHVEAILAHICLLEENWRDQNFLSARHLRCFIRCVVLAAITSWFLHGSPSLKFLKHHFLFDSIAWHLMNTSFSSVLVHVICMTFVHKVQLSGLHDKSNHEWQTIFPKKGDTDPSLNVHPDWSSFVCFWGSNSELTVWCAIPDCCVLQFHFVCSAKRDKVWLITFDTDRIDFFQSAKVHPPSAKGNDSNPQQTGLWCFGNAKMWTVSVHLPLWTMQVTHQLLIIWMSVVQTSNMPKKEVKHCIDPKTWHKMIIFCQTFSLFI